MTGPMALSVLTTTGVSRKAGGLACGWSIRNGSNDHRVAENGGWACCRQQVASLSPDGKEIAYVTTRKLPFAGPRSPCLIARGLHKAVRWAVGESYTIVAERRIFVSQYWRGIISFGF
jgi:hypothetical protein